MKRVIIELTILTVLSVIFFRILGIYVMHLGWVGALAALTIPASIAGELHGRRTGKEATSGFAWQVALISGAVLAFLNTAFLIVRTNFILGFEFGLIIGMSFALFLMSFLLIRLVFRWGVTIGVRKNPQTFDPKIFD